MLASLKEPLRGMAAGPPDDRLGSMLKESEKLSREIEAAAKLEARWPDAKVSTSEDDSIGTFEVDLIEGWCKP